MSTRAPRNLPPRKGPDLDQPWHPGDAIPAPEAVHGDGESAWALWNEVAQQHEQRFAPTAPMPAQAQLSTEEQSWAPTQPASKPVLPQPKRRDPEPLFTLESAMLVARRNNRVCPRPERWQEFSALLPERKTQRGSMQPPPAITGRAWEVTPPLTKRLCFREQIEWAESTGVLEPVMAFLLAMPEQDWLHMGED